MSLQKNDILQLDIQALNSEGIGVARHDGLVVFISGALPGERVSAKVIKLKRSYAIARMEELLAASPQRRISPCPYYKRCGGCALQHMTYAAQLDFKRQRILDCFGRLGGFEHVDVPGVVPSNEFSYRNKAAFPISNGSGGIAIGPFERRSHRVVDIDACMIQHPAGERIVQAIRAYAAECSIPAYDEATGMGVLRHVVTRHTDSGYVVVLVCTELPKGYERLAELCGSVDGVCGVVININARKTNVIMGGEYHTIYGDSRLTEHICGVELVVSPASFLQVNHDQCENLYTQALQWAELGANDVVIDAYCGIGSMSLLFARHCKKVYGIECIAQAVDDARLNASLNRIYNAEFTVGNAEEVMPALLNGIQADVLLLDPPRKGCDPRMISSAIEAGIERIVYVSCNPATLARDAAALTEGGYLLRGIQGFDMFPQTTHVECVAQFAK